VFLPWEHRHTLEPARMGFTGAADDMRVHFGSELHVDGFLRLQPYLWDDPPSQREERFYTTSRVETSGGRCFYPVEEWPPFRQAPCRWPESRCGPVPDEVWDWYGSEQTFDAQLAERTRRARELYEDVRARPELRIWPIYGLHHFPHRLASIADCLQAGAASMEGPVIPLLLNSAADLAGWDSFSRFIGPLPADICHFFYARAGLAGVCEGANSAGMMLTLGRPFLQLTRPGRMSAYLAEAGGEYFADAARRARQAAAALLEGDAQTTAAFLRETASASSQLSRYFRALGAYYQNDLHDKCVWGLLALALALEEQEAA
jgi:hypothetical protein